MDEKQIKEAIAAAVAEALKPVQAEVTKLTNANTELAAKVDAKPDPAKPDPSAQNSVDADARRQVHAMKAVLAKHNITFDVEKADLSKLAVDDKGVVTGDFAYEPGTPTSPTNDGKTPPGSGTGFTMADIQKMSPEQINKNWEAVSAALESQGAA